MNKDVLVAELIIDEGTREKMYFDTKGIPTIGVGRNLRDVGLSRDEIAYLLTNDVRRVEADLDRGLPWWRNLSEVRQRVLANMCFNMGLSRLLGFKKMLTAVQAGDFHEAAAQMLNSAWAAQVGKRATRLADAMQEG